MLRRSIFFQTSKSAKSTSSKKASLQKISSGHGDTVKIHFVTPAQVERNSYRVQTSFAHQYSAKASEIVWRPAASAETPDAAKALDLFAGLGKNPNAMTLMKSTFAAVRKARELNRPDISISVAVPGVTSDSGDCTLTNAMECFLLLLLQQQQQRRNFLSRMTSSSRNFQRTPISRATNTTT